MSLNCNEINLILKELNITGAFIQDIVQPGYDTLAFYTYKEGSAKTVVICTAQNSIRINETSRKIPKNDKPLRFMEFLRANIKGCRINSCEQIGFERVIRMELSRTVTEEIPKKNEQINSVQLPGMAKAFGMNDFYSDSIKQKIEPAEHIENYLLYIKLWNNAANVILCDENNTILETMFRRPERHEIKDEIYLPPTADFSKKDDVISRFPIREWKNTENGVFSTFNEYIDNWYSEHASTLSRESLLEKAQKWYESNHSKKVNALQNLLNKQKSFENANQLKHQGDLILAFGYQLQKDSNYLECEDYDTGKIIRLKINPKLSIQENAAEYYKNYKKALSGADEIKQDIEIIKKQIEKLDSKFEEIQKEKNPVKIEQLLRHDSTPKQQQKKDRPGLEYSVNGWLILVGRDANENDDLLRHHVRGDDLWLHVRDFPGGYVFVKARKGKTVPLDILLDAGNLAVYYSKARNAGKTDLYYTHVKYLRRAKNGPKGLVLPTQEKNLCISTDKERLSKLALLRAESNL